ncbi:short-chain dehydrogenase [Subtercola sp. Z020]|uniref:SDR family NAD(P)-dependent oxidoreductase n=1 Tax=Subtercola sp. Z020 TaxID=2080582 RepID=UPI000CE804C8|nr:SDR family NAD(P)-dependent oxidoreductase [Subtercola sp. Z020]PPF79226.1 short-chain dehydrogenase [Subtercola sp. Z020]
MPATASTTASTWPTDLVIVGATSAIAENCTRLWLEGGASRALLIGRDEAGLDRIATDLRVRFPAAAINTSVTDLLDVPSITSAVQGFAGPGTPGAAAGAGLTVLIAHGSMTDQAESQADLAKAASVLQVTGVSPSLWMEACADTMTAGTIAVLGSVAGDRGRRKNYIYGASKGLIERMAEGLQHRLAASPLNVVLVKPGPTATPMTAGMPASGLAPVSAVAADIVKGVNAARPVVYAPIKWQVIMTVVRLIPRPVFNRLDF